MKKTLLFAALMMFNLVCHAQKFTGSFFGDGTGVTNTALTPTPWNRIDFGQGLLSPGSAGQAAVGTNTVKLLFQGNGDEGGGAGDFFTLRYTYVSPLSADNVPAVFVGTLAGSPANFTETGLFGGFFTVTTANNENGGAGTNDGWSTQAAGAFGFAGNATYNTENNGAGIGVDGFSEGKYQVDCGGEFLAESTSSRISTNVGVYALANSNGVTGSQAAGIIAQITPSLDDPPVETAALIADTGGSKNSPLVIFRLNTIDTSSIDTNGSFRALNSTVGVYTIATNTLTVTASGITNNTAFDYLVSITAGTAMALKDGNGNEFLVPILGSAYPLKPGWRLTGTSITATCVQFP